MPCVGSLGLGDPMTMTVALTAVRPKKENRMRTRPLCFFGIFAAAIATTAVPAFTAGTQSLSLTVTAQPPAAPCIEFATPRRARGSTSGLLPSRLNPYPPNEQGTSSRGSRIARPRPSRF